MDAAGRRAGDGMGELTHGANLSGGLGRFLMISEGASTYGCGAHGNGDASALLFDLASGAAVPMRHADDVIARLGAKALADFRAAEQLDDVEHVNLGESIPVWRAGKLVLRHLLWVDACYACGFGDWSSYTASQWFDDDQVPAPFDAEAAAVPAAVAQALTAASATATGDEPVVTGVSWAHPTTAGPPRSRPDPDGGRPSLNRCRDTYTGDSGDLPARRDWPNHCNSVRP